MEAIQRFPDRGEVEFRQIPDFPGHCIGSDSSVWRWRTRAGRNSHLPGKWKEICQQIRKGRHRGKLRNRQGYKTVVMIRDGKRYYRFVHRLMLEAFVGPCPPGMQACHFPSRDTFDNHISNLRWGTALENSSDKAIHGTKMQGSKSPLAKLCEFDIPHIINLVDAGATREEIAGDFGVSRRTIGGIINGESWKHVTAFSSPVA